MKRKIWNIKKVNDYALRLVRDYGISVPFAQVLINRGIDDLDVFFDASLNGLHSPQLLPDIQKAVKRIHQAIKNGEKILIVGDYDVDGITSLAIFHEFIKDFKQTFSFYIPHRVNEGYGLKKEAIIEAKERGAGLIVAFDCGTNSFQEIELARSFGIDVIVVDHHHPQEGRNLPFAFINPKRSDSKYPFDELSAAALSFKLLQALKEDTCYHALDLVALSVVCDVVPIKGENRILLKEGLKVIKESKRAGIQALCRVSKIRQENISSFHLGFILGPRINASGRVAHAKDALDMFLTQNDEKSYDIACKLSEYNQARKVIETNILKEAANSIPQDCDDCAIVVSGDNWHPGVLGIVASRLMDKYYRPAFVISFNDEIGKGSARSIHSVHLVESLKKCSEYLSNYGGHKKAAGLEIHKSKLNDFKKKINSLVRNSLTPEDFIPVLNIDAQIDFSDISIPLIDELESLKPYGEENPKALFATFNVIKRAPAKKIKNIYSVWLSDGSATYEGIIYNKDILEILDHGKNFDVAYSIEKNVYHNIPRLMVKSLRLADGDF